MYEIVEPSSNFIKAGGALFIGGALLIGASLDMVGLGIHAREGIIASCGGLMALGGTACFREYLKIGINYFPDGPDDGEEACEDVFPENVHQFSARRMRVDTEEEHLDQDIAA